MLVVATFTRSTKNMNLNTHVDMHVLEKTSAGMDSISKHLLDHIIPQGPSKRWVQVFLPEHLMLAFAMGHHPLLGQESSVKLISHDELRQILESVKNTRDQKCTYLMGMYVYEEAYTCVEIEMLHAASLLLDRPLVTRGVLGASILRICAACKLPIR